jgi:hypothetical protein
VLRCHARGACHVRLQVHSGSRVIATRQAAIGGNRTTTVSLSLGHGQPHRVVLSVLSNWNGYPATVTATL